MDCICPYCSTHLLLSPELVIAKYIKCTGCNKDFENPHTRKRLKAPQKEQDSSKDLKIPKGATKWLLIIGIGYLLFHFFGKELVISNSTKIEDAKAGQKSTEYAQKALQKYFIFKSRENDKEINGRIIQTNYETTYHIFDLNRQLIIMKCVLEGEWLTFNYTIESSYVENGLAGKNYVFVINYLGVKEIWLNLDAPSLGYDYDDGTRVSCYRLSPEN